MGCHTGVNGLYVVSEFQTKKAAPALPLPFFPARLMPVDECTRRKLSFVFDTWKSQVLLLKRRAEDDPLGPTRG